MNFNTLADTNRLQKTVENLTAKGYLVSVVETKAEALENIEKIIPKAASVMDGSSRTLEEIKFVEHLKSGDHGWNNLHEKIVAEKDPVAQGNLRQQAVHADYYVGSVHALVENGEFMIASNTGSQLPHLVFTSPNLVLVIGTQKIVSTLTEAFQRLEEYVMPLEDTNMQQKYGMGTVLNKLVISKGESPMMGRKIHIILVKEVVGF